MAGTVLLGWEGFVINGKAVKFNEDNAASLIFYDELARDEISFVANNIDNFITSKNSATRGK